MGFLLRPGHTVVTGSSGWQRVELIEVIKSMRVEVNDLGFWGKSEVTNQIKDAHSIIYSVPNPWSAAYLYDFITRTTQIPIKEKLYDLILSLLYEYASQRSLKLNKISLSGGFKSGIEKLIPEFIKIGDEIIVFQKSGTEEIVGGLSKTSLIWVAQNYSYDNEKIKNIKEDETFLIYLRELKNYVKPNSNPNLFQFSKDEDYDRFWGYEYFDALFEKIKADNNYIPLVIEDVILPIINEQDVESKYFIRELNAYVFNESDIKSGRKLFEKEYSEDLHEKLLKVGIGREIPAFRLVKNWIVLDKYLEPYILKLNSIGKISPKVEANKKFISVLNNEYGFLYPVKPEIVKFFKGDLSKLKFDFQPDDQVINPKISCYDLYIGRKDFEVIEIDRTIAIWPPFKSKVTDNYIFEYGLDLINQPLLEFYDREGEKIKYSTNIFEDFRVYRIKEKFPSYINLKTRVKSDEINGFIYVDEKKKLTDTGKAIVAIDFGTTRTNIAFFEERTEKSEVLTFRESIPIVVSQDDHELFIEQSYFIPYNFREKQPNDLEEIQNLPVPWLPFLSIFRDWLQAINILNKQDDGLLLTGAIYFNVPLKERVDYLIQSANDKSLIMNLKWGVGGGKTADFRYLFLKQLLTMIIVELEVRGYQELEIYWTYPPAFSKNELNQLERVWNDLSNEVSKFLK